ncbi:MAG: hypothetical protein M3P06_00425 [Acidobacteriota bacterium]|nr:hypothetical protein [Acidobacteriota bacterium]
MNSTSKLVGALSIAPILYIVVFTTVLGWWITFDPSEVRNAQSLVIGFYVAIAIHVGAMVLMLALMVYFLQSLRGPSATPAEKAFWVVTLIVFNFLAYPFFYFFYIRPRLNDSTEVDAP